MEDMILKLQKNVEKNTNRIRLPQQFVDTFGNQYYMEVYKDYIKIVPIKKGE